MIMSDKIIIGLIIAILALCGGGYLYFEYSQNKINTLTAANSQLRIAVATQEDTIRAQTDAIQRQNAAMETLQTSAAAAEDRRRELEQEIRNRNLENQALENRSSAEQTINTETQTLFRSIERSTAPNNTSRVRTPRAPTTPAQGAQQ
jgi:chromosome segregation ATPase